MDSCLVTTSYLLQLSCYSEEEVESPFSSLTLVELLKPRGTKLKRLRDSQMLLEESPDIPNNSCSFQSSPTDKIMKFEKARLVQLKSKKADVSPVKLLNMCDVLASKTGNSVQRVVYYLAKALNERIDQEWGIISSDKLKRSRMWTLIMEAFAVRHECPLELLKITAVGTYEKTMEKTSKQLSSFAQTINLPFSFKVVASDLKEEFFDLEADEAVAIALAYQLWSLLAWPNHLEALMAVIQNLKPCFLVLKEVEVCTNAPTFLERFKETLLFISGLIYSTNSCMEKHIRYRKLVEEVHWWEMIRNVLTAEGTERTLRHDKMVSGDSFSKSSVLWNQISAKH
ncbi:DELLA protein GAI1-like [Coffea eugenioides]|uniref:DELLA protein GAI1-like n=1 Tax=Coffea eugenioides TaxID=49369 RepID=UPI000F61333F|nr:DELLA protein GAI1-like [Coffea eugenioides]